MWSSRSEEAPEAWLTLATLSHTRPLQLPSPAAPCFTSAAGQHRRISHKHAFLHRLSSQCRCFSASTEVADNNGSAAAAGGSSLTESGSGEAEAAPKVIRGLPGIRELTEAMEAKLNGTGGIALTKPEKRVMQACLEASSSLGGKGNPE